MKRITIGVVLAFLAACSSSQDGGGVAGGCGGNIIGSGGSGGGGATPTACMTAEDCLELLPSEASMTCLAVYCVPGSLPTPPATTMGCVLGPAPGGVLCDHDACSGYCGSYTGACISPCNTTAGTPGAPPPTCRTAADCTGLNPGPCGALECDLFGTVGAPEVPHVPKGCYVDNKCQ